MGSRAVTIFNPTEWPIINTLGISKKQQTDQQNDMSQELAQYQSLIELGKELLADLDFDRVLKVAMDRLIEISGAERGLIILFDEKKEIIFETARKLNKQDIENPKFEVSRTIINRVKEEGKPVCLQNAFEDPQINKSDSATRLRILSVICLPLKKNEDIFGVIYLDNRTVRGVFKEQTCDFVTIYGDFISLAAYNALEKKRLKSGITALEADLRAKYQFEAIIGSHPKMMEILKLVSQVADTDAIVLIQGESGTGKELIARALHYNSSRIAKPFVPINCGALPENLLESELFGHVRGSFTSATCDKVGWFERAESGTVFLDEVGETSAALQVKLLRVLQTGEYSRVGETKIRHCHVRVVAATNNKLQKMVEQGVFREDLFYRLNVIDISIPPLRERKSDIPLLMQHFLKSFCKKYNRKGIRMSRKAESMLMAYDFPGNCRELENIIQHAILLSKEKYIYPEHLPKYILSNFEHTSSATKISSFRTAKQQIVEKFEKNYVIDCLQASSGNISQAAKIAGINIKNFHQKMKKYSIESYTFKNDTSK